MTRTGEEERIRHAYARRVDRGLYSWLSPGHVYIQQERERGVLAALARAGVTHLQTKRILDIGCGTGSILRELVKWGARPENMVGVDLLADRITVARQLCPAGVELVHGNADHIDFPDCAFDLVIQSTVFTSILDDMVRLGVATEMLRVLKPDGLIVWYDYHLDNPWNDDVRGVSMREIYRLFPACNIHLKRLTPIPQLTRLLAPYSWLSCYIAGLIPLLCTHYVGLIQKPSRSVDVWGR